VVVYLDTRLPLLSDPVVRKALSESTNGQQAASEAIGRGAPPTVGIPTGAWADSGIAPPAFDPGEAARELEDAGWARGSDGVRVKDGQRLEIALSTSNEPYRVAVAEAVARQWRSLGASVRVQPIDAATYIDEHLLGRQFQAAIVEVDPGPDPDPYPFWHSTQIAPPGRNLSGYSTPQLDDVLERARQTTDAARRTELYRLFAATITADVPWVPLYTPVEVYALNERVHGFRPATLFTRGARFAGIQQWYVRTRVE
jgi:peptide/nickel transport system substrate-binding protein